MLLGGEPRCWRGRTSGAGRSVDRARAKLSFQEDIVSDNKCVPVAMLKGLKLENDNNAVRPEVIREIALWWQGQLDLAVLAGETPDPPSCSEVMLRFHCSEEEALRGVGLGEHRHFSGIQ